MNELKIISFVFGAFTVFALCQLNLAAIFFGIIWALCRIAVYVDNNPRAPDLRPPSEIEAENAVKVFKAYITVLSVLGILILWANLTV